MRHPPRKRAIIPTRSCDRFPETAVGRIVRASRVRLAIPVPPRPHVHHPCAPSHPGRLPPRRGRPICARRLGRGRFHGASACHGAGRLKSRTQASKSISADSLLKELNSQGIIVKASSPGTLVEEAPSAYKNINDVVDVVANAGLANRACRMQPLGVIKG